MTARQLVLPAIFLVLVWGFWTSADFTLIAAGVALFLFGMMSLEQGFRAFTGGALETLLRASTDRLWKSIGFGIVSTTLMQSSTLVSLITISFVSAGMITLASGIGIILGTNLGTTTGAWLIAGLGLRVNISAYAMPLLVFGVVLQFRKERLFKGLSYLLLGIGFLFLGIHYMKEGFDAFQDGIDLAAYAVTGYPGLLLYILIGMLITVVMQSSHATMLVVITALSAGQVTYENALALAIGANLGSAITTALGGMTANLGGKRLAIAHVLFNVVTAVVAVTLIDLLRLGVDVVGALLGIASDDFLLKLALFHSLFNLLGVIIMAPLVGRFEALLMRYVQFEDTTGVKPRYLSEEALKVPEAAISAVRKEVLHLYENAFGLIAHGLSLRRRVIGSEQSLREAVQATRRIMPLDMDDAYEQRIKSLHSAIVEYIGRIGTDELPDRWSEELYALRQASQAVVAAVKDMKHLHKNLSRHGVSPNPSIRECYDEIRLQLASLLREIEELRGQEPDAVTSLSLDAYKLALERFYRRINATLEDLIRRRRMTGQVATSLMNDVSYAHDIGKNLVAMAQTLLVVPEQAMRAAQQQLALDDAEIEQALDERSHDMTPGTTRGEASVRDR